MTWRMHHDMTSFKNEDVGKNKSPLQDEITRERPLPRPENQSEAKEKLEKTMMNDDGICICGDW